MSSSSWCLTRSLLRQGWASFRDICQHTSSRSLLTWRWPVSALPPAKRRARLNTCRSRPASARCTRCRCFYVFVLVLLFHHKSIGGRLFLLPQAAQDGLVLCHLSREDTSRGVPSQGRHRSKVCVCVQKVGDSVFVLVSHSRHKTSRLWTLAQNFIPEWEQRKKRSVEGGAPCESRKTVFCVPFPLASDSCHDQASAWLLGDVAETEKSSSVAGVLVLNCFFCCVSPGMSTEQDFPNSEGRGRRTALQKLSGSFASQLNLATIRMDMCLF